MTDRTTTTATTTAGPGPDPFDRRESSRIRSEQAEQLPFFVYGTLRPGEQHHAWALRGRTREERPAAMDGLVLYDGPGYPYAVAGDGVVVGELVRPQPAVYAEVLRVLDELEEYEPGAVAHYYERAIGAARLPDGGSVRAWVYLGSAPLAARLAAGGTRIPGGDWLRRAER